MSSSHEEEIPQPVCCESQMAAFDSSSSKSKPEHRDFRKFEALAASQRPVARDDVSDPIRDDRFNIVERNRARGALRTCLSLSCVRSGLG